MNCYIYLFKSNAKCDVFFLCFAVPKKSYTPTVFHPLRRPLPQWASPVFVSDSDDDEENIVIKSTWKNRHSKPKPTPKADQKKSLRFDEDDSSPFLRSPPIHSPFFLLPDKTQTSLASPKRTLSAPPKMDDSSSSEEEFISLLERLKKKNKFPGTSFSPRSTNGTGFIQIVAPEQSLALVLIVVLRLILIVLFLNVENNKEPPVPAPFVKGFSIPVSKPLRETPLQTKTPGKPAILKPMVSQTEPRHGPTSRYVC